MISKSDLKKPLKSLSKLRQEEVLKYQRAQEEEKIEVLGQDSELKALPWVSKEVEAEEEIKINYFYSMTSLLSQNTKDRKAYIRILGQVFLHFCEDEYLPKKYFIEVDLNDIGVVVNLKGTKYYGAFKACGLPSYDFRACQIMAIKLGNTVGKLEGHFQKSEGGVVLPDQEDLKVYG